MGGNKSSLPPQTRSHPTLVLNTIQGSKVKLLDQARLQRVTTWPRQMCSIILGNRGRLLRFLAPLDKSSEASSSRMQACSTNRCKEALEQRRSLLSTPANTILDQRKEEAQRVAVQRWDLRAGYESTTTPC